MALEETWKILVCLNSKDLYCFVLVYNTKPNSDAQSLNSHQQSKPEIIQVGHGCSKWQKSSCLVCRRKEEEMAVSLRCIDDTNLLSRILSTERTYQHFHKIYSYLLCDPSCVRHYETRRNIIMWQQPSLTQQAYLILCATGKEKREREGGREGERENQERKRKIRM